MTTRRLLATVAERERYARVLQAAEVMLGEEGEHGLQMKQLAERSDVALGTLYRYFPSKDHVLGAIALERHRRMFDRIDTMHFEGETAGERASDMMLREFRAVQRDPEISVALQRVATAPDIATSEYIGGIRKLLEQMVVVAIEYRGSTATAEQRQLVPIFLAAVGGAYTDWLSGIVSADEVRAQVNNAARLFDLPGDVVREYLWIDPRWASDAAHDVSKRTREQVAHPAEQRRA